MFFVMFRPDQIDRTGRAIRETKPRGPLKINSPLKRRLGPHIRSQRRLALFDYHDLLQNEVGIEGVDVVIQAGGAEGLIDLALDDLGLTASGLLVSLGSSATSFSASFFSLARTSAGMSSRER